MGWSILCPHLFVSSFLLFALFLNGVHGTKKCYIAYLGAHPHGSTPSTIDLETATDSHYNLLASILGSHEKAKEAIIYSYNIHINGFAALLEEEEAQDLASKKINRSDLFRPLHLSGAVIGVLKGNVISVFLSKEHKLHTTRSWEFLGLQGNAMNTAWQKGRYGVNTIIANIDTGVWPESKSFSDEGIGPIPSKWLGGQVCQIDKLSASTKPPCNRKLIGARFFSKAFEAANGKLNSSQLTARDFVGHGTHTLSTSGGNFVPNANIFGNGNGTAKGGSPKARVAAYKVCWSQTDETKCYGADLLSAIDQAISDGVDVITISAGGEISVSPEQIFTDEVSIGSFHALSNNIVVVASAGNDGPEPGTVLNVAPWLFTVAASTIDRDFTSTLTLGNNDEYMGASLFVNLPPQKSFTLISSTDAKLANATFQDAQFCKPGTLDPAKVNGSVVICVREGKTRSVAEGEEALSAGASGMILSNNNQSGNTVLAEPHVLSTTNTVNQVFKPNINEYYNSTKNATLVMSEAKTVLGIKPAPVMASFSSRGPNLVVPSILKPDITAPGVNILAAFSEAASASNLPSDTRRGFPFNVLQGTSMSCPHIAGVAGLLKTLHPNWSPAAIKSAIMTTASTRDNTNRPIRDAFDETLATPFAYGSGHVQPDLAMDPGLVYDITVSDYLNFLCASGYDQTLILALNSNKSFTCSKSFSITDLNYPSMTLPNMELSAVNVTRTVTNVGPPSTYIASVKLPGFKIVVVPNSLTFKKLGEKKTFQVIVQATSMTQRGNYTFGELRWTDNGKHIVRSPIVARLD